MNLTEKFRDADWHNCRQIGSYELDLVEVGGQNVPQFIVLQSAAVDGLTAYRWIALAEGEEQIVACGQPHPNEEAAIAEATKYACLAETMRHADWHNCKLIGCMVIRDESGRKIPRFVFLQSTVIDGLSVYRWATIDEDEETIVAFGQPLLDERGASRDGAEWALYVTMCLPLTCEVPWTVTSCVILRFFEIYDEPESPQSPPSG